VATPGKKPTPKKKPTVRKKPAAKRKKKKPLSPFWLILPGVVLLILLSPFYYGYVVRFFSSTWRWMTDAGENPNYRTYKSFNIKIPKKYSIHGIDVSYYQGKIDWHKVKAMKDDGVQIRFVFIKTSEGILNVDPYFQRNWREAAKVGLITGAYHYFIPKRSGLLQARFFLQNVKPEKGDLPLVADVEELDDVPPQKMRDELSKFLKEIESRTKVKPIIYTGKKFYEDYLMGYFPGYTLWIAHYDQPELALDTSNRWRFWQHSDKAKINGINHVVDFDAFRGDSLAFEQMLVH
jgi:lysozyme